MANLKSGHVFIEVVSGREGPSLSIGNERTGYRLAGPKPWGGGSVIHQFQVNIEELRGAMAEIMARFTAHITGRNGRCLDRVAASSAQPTYCPFCDSGLMLTEEQAHVVADLSKRLDVSPNKVWHLTLATYQLKVLGVPEVGGKAAPAPSGEPLNGRDNEERRTEHTEPGGRSARRSNDRRSNRATGHRVG